MLVSPVFARFPEIRAFELRSWRCKYICSFEGPGIYIYIYICRTLFIYIYIYHIILYYNIIYIYILYTPLTFTMEVEDSLPWKWGTQTCFLIFCRSCIMSSFPGKTGPAWSNHSLSSNRPTLLKHVARNLTVRPDSWLWHNRTICWLRK